MNNPLEVIIHSSIRIKDIAVWHPEIVFTVKDKQEFINNHSKCHGCDLWFVNTSFSSFVLGVVLCHKCDY